MNDVFSEVSPSLNPISLFRQRTECASDVAAVQKCFEMSLLAVGFKHYIYLYIALPFTSAERPFFLSNLAPTWIDRYINDNLYLYDPILQVALQDVVPFDWTQLHRRHNLSTTEMRVLEEAASHGYYGAGTTIPLQGPGPARAFLSVPADNAAEADDEAAAERVRNCHLLGLNLHSRLRPLLAAEDVSGSANLTRRELECLLWAARGKTSWETAVILEISEATVNFHLVNTMKKLHVFSRSHAIAKAVGLGLIYV